MRHLETLANLLMRRGRRVSSTKARPSNPDISTPEGFWDILAQVPPSFLGSLQYDPTPRYCFVQGLKGPFCRSLFLMSGISFWAASAGVPASGLPRTALGTAAFGAFLGILGLSCGGVLGLLGTGLVNKV